MSAFSEILPLFGVDAANGFMMVPVGGFNLVYHFLGKDASFIVDVDSRPPHPSSAVSIKDVTDQIRKAPAVTAISNNSKQPLFVDGDDMKAFLTAAFKGLTSDPSQRLLAVSASTIGVYTVTLKSPRRTESLTVWALNQRGADKPHRISFRYLKYIGDWPPAGATKDTIDSYSRGVTRSKDEGEKYAKLLSQYFRHQANIAVTLQSSDDLKFNSSFGNGITNAYYKEYLVPNLDNSADTTIFVVPGIPGAEGISLIDGTHRGLMVADNPKIVWAGTPGDPFQLVSAHELTHTLGSHHRDQGGLLMSDYKYKQSLLMDKDTLVEINPPFKR